MKKFLLGTIGALAMVTSASAADLAARPYTKAPAMVAAVYDWSGFYIGLNGGGGSSHKCWDIVTNILGAAVVPPVSEGCHDATGAVAHLAVIEVVPAQDVLTDIRVSDRLGHFVRLDSGQLLQGGAASAAARW